MVRPARVGHGKTWAVPKFLIGMLWSGQARPGLAGWGEARNSLPTLGSNLNVGLSRGAVWSGLPGSGAVGRGLVWQGKGGKSYYEVYKASRGKVRRGGFRYGRVRLG